MILSDRDLRNALSRPNGNVGSSNRYHTPLVIDPLEDSQIQPASIDLTLDEEFQYQGSEGERQLTVMELERGSEYAPSLAIDLNHVPFAFETWPLQTIKTSGFCLLPGDFALCSTVERVEIPDDLCARVEGKSSLGRLGLLVHLTAGYIDPGFKGKITLEAVNLSSRPIILRAGRSVCQLSVLQLSSPAEFPYGHENLNSKYQDQTAVTASRYEG